MTVWPHASLTQRATCPPSAAVRQRSMADITFSCPRLTWPRLASRQAASCWKHVFDMTVAEDIRNLQSWTGHEGRGLLGRLVLLVLLGQLIERAHHLSPPFSPYLGECGVAGPVLACFVRGERRVCRGSG